MTIPGPPGVSDVEFFRALLRFDEAETLQALLANALDVLVERVGPSQALIELSHDSATGEDSHVVAYGCEEARLAEIRSLVSRGIIGAAMATGKTILTSNAAEDPRFLGFESVRLHRLEAVLCAPLGRDVPIGVVYLQGRSAKGSIAYSDKLREDVDLFARALSTTAERLLARSRATVPPRPAESSEDDAFGAILGRSQALRDVVDRLRLAAPLDVHILLTGPTGSGKTLFANAVHLASRRRTRRFVEINCAAIPEGLLENEMFGAEPGAHSAVHRGALKGKVEAAEGGTLFLDEVGELSLGSQAKLLQLLQSKTYYRLGGTETRVADVRVLAATNLNLKLAVAEKRFREDLYFRLKVLDVRIPSLAERPDDLGPLSVRFLRDAVERHELGRKSLAPSALRAIQTAEWPGNVRELAHRMESAALQAHLRASDWVENRDIFPEAGEANASDTPTLQEGTRRYQKQLLLSVLQSTDWSMVDTSRILDVSRSHVYNLVRAFELKRG